MAIFAWHSDAFLPMVAAADCRSRWSGPIVSYGMGLACLMFALLGYRELEGR